MDETASALAMALPPSGSNTVSANSDRQPENKLSGSGSGGLRYGFETGDAPLAGGAPAGFSGINPLAARAPNGLLESSAVRRTAGVHGGGWRDRHLGIDARAAPLDALIFGLGFQRLLERPAQAGPRRGRPTLALRTYRDQFDMRFRSGAFESLLSAHEMPDSRGVVPDAFRWSM